MPEDTPQQPQTPQPPQPPPHPGYQYAPAPSPRQTKEQEPTGGVHRWVKYGKFLAAAVVTFMIGSFCFSTTKGSNEVQKSASKLMAEGPKLTGRQVIDAQKDLDQKQRKLEIAQRDLEEKQKGLVTPASATQNGTTATQDATQAGAGTQGTPQLSPAEQVREQIKAERVKQEYESLWSSPIVVARETKTAPGETRTTPAVTLVSDREKPAIEHSFQKLQDPNQKYFPYNKADGPYHVIQRGTLIGATLMNALDGEHAGPVIAQIDKGDQVYVKNTQVVLWPEGTQVLGTTQPVASGNQRLMSVSFDAVIMPDGYAMSLKSIGLSQAGQSGLTGDVNHHVASKLGWATVLGVIQGVSNGALIPQSNSGTTTIIRAPGQDMSQVLQDQMNQTATIKIPAGTRIKIPVMEDVADVPEYENHDMKPGSL
jgi:type IV secretion system protein VirB10